MASPEKAYVSLEDEGRVEMDASQQNMGKRYPLVPVPMPTTRYKATQCREHSRSP